MLPSLSPIREAIVESEKPNLFAFQINSTEIFSLDNLVSCDVYVALGERVRVLLDLLA